MAERIVPTPEQLRELLRYEPDTGKLFWRERPPKMFEGGAYPPERTAKRWNTRYAGAEAMTALKDGGYRTGRVMGRQYLSHRICWVLHYGSWPTSGVDHINGVTGDNRIVNLRDETQSENMRNTKRRSNNKSGVKGVFWVERDGKWEAQICIDGKKRSLGKYFDIEDAANAYREAAKRIHGEFANFG